MCTQFQAQRQLCTTGAKFYDQMNKSMQRTRYRIHDREGLAAQIRAAIREQHGGNVSAAARSVRLNQPELYRLSVGRIGAIGPRTFTRLVKLMRGNVRSIEATLISPRAQRFAADHKAWMAAENERFLERRTVGSSDIAQASQSFAGWEFERIAERVELLAHLRRQLPDLFAGFDRFLVRRQHTAQRADLAYTRIVAPLMDALESGFVERRWQEMKSSELRQFVKAGMQRERILLTRAPDVQRTQEAAERDPLELMSLFSAALVDRRSVHARRSHPLLIEYMKTHGR